MFGLTDSSLSEVIHMTLRVLLFAIVTLFATSQSFSHSGGTDAYGCHTNHKTGHYHCHTPKATNEIIQDQSRQPSSIESQFESPKQYCCKICKKGKACGDSCISRSKSCTKSAGCACDG